MKFLSSLAIFAVCLFSACSSVKTATDPIPEHETFQVRAQVLGEDRVINVWTPEDYASSTDSLPVLYMLDGGVKEDFPHVANTVSELVAAGKVPAMILVGVENTQRRRDLTGFTEVDSDKEVAPVVGGSAVFRDFVRDELIPEVKKRYRVTSDRGLIGESLAGYFVMETLMEEPGLFNRYIAFDPSIWWNNAYLVRSASEKLAAFTEADVRVWFAGSGVSDIAPHTQALAKVFERANVDGVTWFYSDEPKEEHSTIFRATKEKALVWMYGNE